MKPVLALLIALLLMPLEKLHTAEFHVSPNGNDTNPGTPGKPFLTLERAREAARQEKGSTVCLAPGTYRRTNTFLLDERDSHTTYRGAGARIMGGIAVPPGSVRPVSETAMVERLLPEVRGKVLEIDVRALGVDDLGAIGPRGFGRPYLTAPLELFVDNEPLTLSRWPKRGEPGVPIGKILDNGDRTRGGTFEFAVDRPARWTHADNAWITGFFFYGYADDTLQVKSIDAEKKTLTTVQRHGYGFNSGKAWNRWFALNLIEEIAQPGEFAIDPKAGKLYFLPPAGKDIAQCRLEVSAMREPLVAIQGATGVVFDGMEFTCSRGTGMYIERGANNRVQNATFCNLGVVAVCIGQGRPLANSGQPAWELGEIVSYFYGHTTWNRQAGTGHGVVNCRIYNIGAGGISLGGGDRLSLTPAGNFVENCEIHHFNRWDRTYRAAVNIDGVGNSIRHCLIHDCPGSAIYLHGNDHLIEYNEIHHAMMEGDDHGAFYMGRDPTERGIVIRYNYWHDSALVNHTHCLYFDDSGGDSAKVYGNVFRKTGNLSTVNINGGSNVLVTNNIFIDCKKPVRMGFGGNEWRTRDGRFESLMKAVGYDKSPWRDRYPELLGYLEARPQMPRGNLFAKNLLVNSTLTEEKGIIEENNRSVEKDPGLTDIGIPGFESIPFDKIGLIKNPKQ